MYSQQGATAHTPIYVFVVVHLQARLVLPTPCGYAEAHVHATARCLTRAVTGEIRVFAIRASKYHKLSYQKPHQILIDHMYFKQRALKRGVEVLSPACDELDIPII